MARVEGPYMSLGEQSDDDEDDDEKEQSRNSRRLKLPLLPQDKAEAVGGNRRSFGRVFELGGLMLDKDKVVEKPDGDKKAENGKESAEADAQTAETESGVPEREDYRLKSNQLAGGEYIVDLDKPAQEVVLLRAEQGLADAADMPSGEAPLQQQPASFEVPEPAEPEPQAGGGGEVPPTEPPEGPGETPGFNDEPEPEAGPPASEDLPVPAFNQQPEAAPTAGQTEREPAEIYREYIERDRQAAALRTADELATKQDIKNAVRDESRRWRKRGWKRGFNVGAAYEHLLHGRRETKTERRARMQQEHLEKARQTFDFGVREQERQQTLAGARLSAAERSFENAEQKYDDQTRRLQQALEQTQEQLAVPPEHRLETSAWLTSQVDRRTGKVVESPVFQYGKEYYRERAQETAPLQQRNAAAGGVALVAAATTPDNVQQPASDGALLPPVNIPSASMHGAPSAAHGQQPGGTPQQPVSSAAPLWPWVLALVVIVIGLIVALR